MLSFSLSQQRASLTRWSGHRVGQGQAIRVRVRVRWAWQSYVHCLKQETDRLLLLHWLLAIFESMVSFSSIKTFEVGIRASDLYVVSIILGGSQMIRLQCHKCRFGQGSAASRREVEVCPALPSTGTFFRVLLSSHPENSLITSLARYGVRMRTKRLAQPCKGRTNRLAARAFTIHNLPSVLADFTCSNTCAGQHSAQIRSKIYKNIP